MHAPTYAKKGTVPPPPAAPRAFCALTLALALPFWALGAVAARPLLPGLPASALMAVCPLAAAALLARRARGVAGLHALVQRTADYRRIPGRRGWALVLLPPGVVLVTYGVTRALGRPLPAVEWSVPATLALLVVFLAGALSEEVGWSGYAADPLLARHGVAGAGVRLGAVWAVWHLVPLVQAGRAPGWIAGWALSTGALRVLLVWLYARTRRSVCAAALGHAGFNVAWQLFPAHGSHWDPRVGGPLMAVVAAVLVVAVPVGRAPPSATGRHRTGA